MPELISKYPDSALRILKSGKINCGNGAPQNILVTCPKENFCSLPQGELCIYDVKNTFSSTQINMVDLFRMPDIVIPLLGVFLVVFMLGVVVGRKFR